MTNRSSSLEAYEMEGAVPVPIHSDLGLDHKEMTKGNFH